MNTEKETETKTENPRTAWPNGPEIDAEDWFSLDGIEAFLPMPEGTYILSYNVTLIEQVEIMHTPIDGLKNYYRTVSQKQEKGAFQKMRKLDF